ncbi:MAG: UDPGP type 1 family protein [Phycisphaerae bacterium]|jgi:UDP-N-acetylglucosamine/UDP-N-acetylgalactosamine diphosphorylase
MDIRAVRQKLDKHGQSHLLRYYDELSDSKRTVLLEQIASIDFDKMDELIARYVLEKPVVRPMGQISPPPIVSARSTDAAAQAELKAARRRGEQLISEGKVAAFVVAGGQGTRLGYEGPKGCLEVTAVAKKSLFQVFAEQILAASHRHRVTIPWYIMTSQANDVATRAFFRQNQFFGLNAKDVFFFPQGMMPAIGLDGKLLLSDKGSMAMSPDGHGGCLAAMRRSGALEDMAKRGVELISYFQVDNPLVHCIDPLFLGLHDLRKAQMSAKALPKRDPMERLGNFCVVDGKVTVIEYSDMPEELARATTESGRLKFSSGSIAIHILSRAFVEKLTAADGKLSLPFHRADKAVACVDESGNVVKPAKPNAVKLEMFVFDAMPLAEATAILETDRAEEFSPVKNATGEDSLASSLHDQVRRAAAWLEAAGVKIPRDADGHVAAAIEISPLLADSAAALIGKVDPKKTVISGGQSLYLG